MMYKIKHKGSFDNRDNIQVQWVMPQDYHRAADYSFNKARQGRPMPDTIKLPQLELCSGAYHTDYLSIPGIDSFFMVFSEKLFRATERLQIPELRVIENLIIDGKVYHAIHFETHQTNEIINWNDSTFLVRNAREMDSKTIIYLDNHQSYISYLRKLVAKDGGSYFLRNKNIVLNSIALDLFYSGTPYFGKFCSENFKKMIEDSGFTGFQFEEV